MENRWSSSGNIPRIHNIWPPRKIQEFMKERKCDPEQFKKQDHLHVNVQRHCMGRKRNWRKMYTKLRIMPADFLAVIGHSRDLDQKRSGTELTLTNLMVFGTKLPKTWWLNSQKPFIHCSVLLSARERGEVRSKRGRSEQNVELILRTVMSANQLNI